MVVYSGELALSHLDYYNYLGERSGLRTCIMTIGGRHIKELVTSGKHNNYGLLRILQNQFLSLYYTLKDN